MLVPALAGCSAVRLTYGQGSMLAYWWLDGYVDFTGDQAAPVRSALDDWFAWHRATQLPDYAVLLDSVARQAADKVTPAQVCSVLEQGEQRLLVAFDHAVPAMASIVRGFTPAQLRHLEQRYAKSDDDLAREHLERPEAERLAAAQRRWQERSESFYGELGEAQRKLLADGVAALPFDARTWIAERRQRHADIVAGLRRLAAERADAPRIESALRGFAQQSSRSPRPGYRAFRQRLTQAQCALVAQLHNSTGPAQRARAIAKVRQYEDDLRALARQGPPVRAPEAPSLAGG